MITLQSDQVFGIYTQVEAADLPRLRKWLSGRKIDFLVDPEECARLNVPDRTTIVFDEKDAEKIKRLLMKIEKEVEITEEPPRFRNGAYQPPVAKLLELGDAALDSDPKSILNLGLLPEHAPDLLRMALDPELHSEAAESVAIWAPIYAWRALAFLNAKEAVVPLISLFHRLDDDEGDDMIANDLPCAIAIFGAVAIPPLTGAMADGSRGVYARAAASTALAQIGITHPESRESCVAALSAQLERCTGQPADLNGFLISDLLELKAVEAAPIMEKAFAAGCVDDTIAGDWRMVQLELLGHPGKTSWAGSDDDGKKARPPIPLLLPQKIARNAQCPCGSGKKYKKCCGAAS